jgi:hypothetical protein
VHRVAYIVDPRGVGHSTPLQTCPEATQVTALTTDEGSALAGASQRCLERLRAAGEDPALFGPEAVAADAVDLRHALGLTHWNVMTFGSASVDADALLRRDAGAVRSLIEDSPTPVTTVTAAEQIDAAYARLTAECRASARCRHEFPHLATLWRQESARLARQPLAVPGGTIDEVSLAKVVRTMLAGNGPAGPAALPAALTTLIHHRTAPASVSGVLSHDSAACVGFRPECHRDVSLAAFLTALCPGLRADPVYAKACSGWPSATSTRTTARVPTLILFGALDPYVDAPALLGRATPTTFVVQVPHQTHNALGFDDCPIAIRNAWVDQPDTAPPAGCLADMQPLPFATP